MNKIHKIACLIGMMILLNANALAQGQGSYGGMLLDLIAEMFKMSKMSLIGSLTELYLVIHVIYIIHGIKLWRNKENIINWNEVRTNWIVCNLFLLIVGMPIFGHAFDIGYEFYKSNQAEKERKRIYQERVQTNVFNAHAGSHVTLTKTQKIAGIIMPKGTKIKLAQNLSPELPEYKKIDSATFPKPVMWNDIPITEISTYRDKMKISSDTQIQLGKWFCGNTKVLKGKKTQTVWDTTTKWKPLPDTMANLNDDNFEQSMYLHSCNLTETQTVHLPVFDISAFPVSGDLERRENDTFQDTSKGLWRVYGRFNQLGFDTEYLTILVDAEKNVHGFSFKLRKPHEYCYLHENSLLAWHKSQPDTFFVSHENATLYSKRPEYYQSCWFKGIQPVSLEEMQKIMSQ